MIPFPYLSAHPTGSRYTVMPAVLGTDDDWLVLVENLEVAVESLQVPDDYPLGSPWMACFHEYNPEIEPGRWQAWRNGSLNLIITDDKQLYLRKVAATLLAQKLNLGEKEDRIQLFRLIQGNEGPANYTGRLP